MTYQQIYRGPNRCLSYTITFHIRCVTLLEQLLGAVVIESLV